MWELEELRKTLAALYFTQKEIISLLVRSGLAPENYELEGRASVTWTLILKRLQQQELVQQLVTTARQDYPVNPVFVAFLQGLLVKSVYAGKAPAWQGSPTPQRLEKIMGEQSTLLPIHFLEMGMEKAKAVAKVVTPTGSGSGFLISADGLFLTNNHVWEGSNEAASSQVIFNYQLSPGGKVAASKSFSVDGNSFATSIDDDWSVARLVNIPVADYGYLSLQSGVLTHVNDYVNIIQHPGGEFKQIGLYHNVVTFTNEHIVQYLTDTMPGSSGSPVFNSKWEVVALHNSGGWLPEPGLDTEVLRNQGININRVITGIRSLGFNI